MTSPFDEAKYKALLNGLEATEVKLSEVLENNETFRFDSEYFRKEIVSLIATSKNLKPLADFVNDGYRVVYETTKIIDSEIGKANNSPIFLQATDLQTPFINTENLFYVDESDWARYGKGRIKPGEILIEVKGKAEKVAFVPEAFPEKVLVSGSLYKLTVNDKINKYYLLAYLISKYGQALKDRTKTNLLISFISKSDLYKLPVPVATEFVQKQIERVILNAYKMREQSKALYAEAESLLLNELGLENVDLSHEQTYERRFSEVHAAERFDAEYFHPEKRYILEELAKMKGEPIKHHFASVYDLVPFAAPSEEKVQNYDLTAALRFFLDDIEPLPAYELGSTKKRFQRGDVVVSRLRSYLKEIAIVDTNPDSACVGSSEFIVLRPLSDSICSELLSVYLRSAPVQKILKWSQEGSNHPRFKEEELLSIKLPERVIAVQNTIKALVREAIDVHRESKRLLEVAKRGVEMAIEESEEAALKWMEQNRVT